MIDWIDLYVEGDPHPRRFDGYATLRAYLLKMERLSEDAADRLVIENRIDPPHARRGYLIKRPYANT